MIGADACRFGNLLLKAGRHQRRRAGRALPHPNTERAPRLIHRPHHRLGHSGGAPGGGKEQRLRVIMDGKAFGNRRFAQSCPIRAAHIHHHGAVRHGGACGIGKIAFREQRLQAESIEDVRQFTRLVVVVHIDGHRAGLHATKIGEHVIRGVAQHLSRNVPGLHPARFQASGDPVGDGIKFAPGNDARAMHQRRAFGRNRRRQRLHRHPEICACKSHIAHISLSLSLAPGAPAFP